MLRLVSVSPSFIMSETKTVPEGMSTEGLTREALRLSAIATPLASEKLTKKCLKLVKKG